MTRPTPDRRLFAPLLPPGAVVVTSAREVAAPLSPDERQAVSAAVGSRVAEFTTGRSCAHEALALLGRPAASIARGARGEPLWPDGVVGSITHCEGLRAAAVARREDVLALGIDAEPNLALPTDVVELTLTPPERERLAAVRTAAPEVHWDRLVFSLKESTYKVWFPLTGQWLGFEEVDTVVRPDGTFTVHLPRGIAVDGGRHNAVHGHWALTDGLLLTAAALTGDGLPGRGRAVPASGGPSTR